MGGPRLKRAILRDTALKPTHTASHVRPSTLLLCGRVFPCSSSEYRRCEIKSNFGFASPDRGVLCPLLPFGLSSPVPKGLHSSHHAGLTFRLIKKFVSCTSIIKRRNALTENPARAEEFGTRALRPCLLNASSALGTHFSRRDLQAWANARPRCKFG